MKIMTFVIPLSVAAIAAAASAQVANAGGSFLPEGFEARRPNPVKIKGRVTIVDGRVLQFVTGRQRVRLAGIDGCDLPQWIFVAPRRQADLSTPLYPLPCGGLAKAWLARQVGNRPVVCIIDRAKQDKTLEMFGRCSVGTKDLAISLLAAGWARIATSIPIDHGYWQAQQSAMTDRHGMWGTFVLDMNEWRQKAIDKTLDRMPQADANLLLERRLEISPAFTDLHQQPRRRDR